MPTIPSNENADRLMTTEEVAAYLGYAVQTIYNKLQSDPEFPVVRLGRTLRFRRSEVDAWIEQKNAEAQSAA